MLKIIIATCVFAGVAGQDGCKAPATISETTGTIQSPYYQYFPNFTYPINAKCRWTINVPAGKNIQLTFSPAFHLEVGSSSSQCSYDYITLYSPSSAAPNQLICSRDMRPPSTLVYGPFCGEQSPGSFIIGNNSVQVEFCTDGSQNFQGFEMEFSATDEPATGFQGLTVTPLLTETTTNTPNRTCGGNITVDGMNSTVFIESPNYPQEYPNSVRCTWTVTGPSGKFLQIDPIVFDLEGGAGCNYDALSITDLTVGGTLGRFCGNSIKWRVRSKGNKVELLFVTDNSATRVGFRLSIKVPLCDGDLDSCPNDPNSETCFGPAMLCDGKPDCPGAEDENCPHGCGIAERKPLLSTKSETGKISGGMEAIPHSWPWNVVVSEAVGRNKICTGTVIDPQWVLTAGPCCSSTYDNIANLADYSVRVGEHDQEGDREPHARTYPVQKVVRHTGLALQSSMEICLVKTKMPIFFNSDVAPVCLPSKIDPPAGTRCYATSWGIYWPEGQTLKQVDLQIANASYCRATASYNGLPFTPAMICTNPEKEKEIDCQSDRGGPLVCPSADDPNRWEVVGVQPYNDCAFYGSEKPGVFARTSFLLNWIAETVISS